MQDSTRDDLAAAAAPSMRVLAVTGAGGGIGRALARGFADAGLAVAALGRTRETLLETAEGRSGVHPFVLDVADADACARVFAEIEATLGAVDVLIANAAVYPRVHFLDQDAARFNAVMRINVEGAANSIRAVLPGMLARNLGRIVVIGSLADVNPIPGAVAYSVSKGALHALVKGVAAEIDRDRYPDVLINELTPGVTRTSMSAVGDPPEAAFAHVKALVDLPSGGPSGRFFARDREIRLGETWKGALKRRLIGWMR